MDSQLGNMPGPLTPDPWLSSNSTMSLYWGILSRSPIYKRRLNSEPGAAEIIRHFWANCHDLLNPHSRELSSSTTMPHFKDGETEAHRRKPTCSTVRWWTSPFLFPVPDSFPTPQREVRLNDIMSERALKCLEAAAPGPPRGR